MNKLKKVLIIDDDEVVCYIASNLLSDMHITDETVCVHDGETALKYIQENCTNDAIERGIAPDLIFLDINMAGLDGFDVLEGLDQLVGVDMYPPNQVHLAY